MSIERCIISIEAATCQNGRQANPAVLGLLSSSRNVQGILGNAGQGEADLSLPSFFAVRHWPYRHGRYILWHRSGEMNKGWGAGFNIGDG
jgi:hypothetical protein